MLDIDYLVRRSDSILAYPLDYYARMLRYGISFDRFLCFQGMH